MLKTTVSAVLVLSILVALESDADAGRRGRPRCRRCVCCCPVVPEIAFKGGNTVERLAARLAELEAFVNNQPDISEANKSKILERLNRIGTPKTATADSGVPELDDGVPRLTRDSVNSVQGEVKTIKFALDSFKRALGLPTP